MAKEDFCFTYYDGDAARDTTHMNRLERGAYHDMVISQRKFGHLSLDQVKKILGRDFAECWPAIELIMKVDTEGKFFIEWLDTSIQKMRVQSKHQSENGKKGGRPKANHNPTKSQTEPEQKPLGDGDGNGDSELKNKKELKKDSRETIDERLNNALDEIYIEQQRMKWPLIDFDLELFGFVEKVRGSPDKYQNHDTGGLRLAFQAQLRSAKKKTNGNKFNKFDRTEQNRNDLAIILQHASSGSDPQ
jgi:hypothetical protein